MAHQKLRDLGMDTMERLYYERQDARQKAYAARKKSISKKKSISARRHQIEMDSVVFDRAIRESCYYEIEDVC